MAAVHPFISAIRRERIARGWTQKQLALRAGYHQSQVCEYENGQRTPPIHKVVDLVNALGGVVELKFPARCA